MYKKELKKQKLKKKSIIIIRLLTLKAARFLITPLLAILEKFFSVSKLKKMMIIPKN